ncbi:TadE/TadG family type IV pilus assembly protein [Prosthecomicrobium sp. N25]|uniref:TadE/TadG family type IV pilus assembly protein n=1 Tax=Prosthecomicrobium sp. N25 TaxID=3129254 RepID=UPI0030781791
MAPRLPLPLLDRFRRDDRGAAMLEAVVALPVVAALGFGVLEFGNVLYGYHLIQTGVRDAARYLARSDDGCTDATKQDYARNIVLYGKITATGNKRVSWLNSADVTFPACATPVAAGTLRGGTVRTLTVQAAPTYTNVGFFSFLGLGTLTFNISHTERAIGE